MKAQISQCFGVDIWNRTLRFSALHIFTISLLFSVSPSSLYALPQEGQVQAGSASIDQVSNTRTNILQTSDKAIIDWRSFNIDNNELVDFQLPSSSSVTLNRVTGGKQSNIFGRLSSNGQLMLINPNGILFGNGAQIDVHGLLATTTDIRNEDFMSGNYNFNIAPSSSGVVVNRGTITAAQGGLVALVAPGVENSGVIQAKLGIVTLAAGRTFTLDLYGDGLINLAVDSKVLQKVTGLNGNKLTSLINNNGSIQADGGTVLLSVNAAKDVVENVINMSGIIQGRSMKEKTGEITLNGGSEGVVNVSGTLDASGRNAGEKGGKVQVLGNKVGLFQNANVDVSGDTGGGTALIGGDYQGKGSVRNANRTFLSKDSRIQADALTNGDGGKVIVWADDRANVQGSISARGGQNGGNGGFVETSGKNSLQVTQTPDVSAPKGKGGEWLLDPTNIEIVAGNGKTDSDDDPFSSSDDLTRIGVDLIRDALRGGSSVTLITGAEGSGDGNIIFNAALNTQGSGNNTLTLNAINDIIINESISGMVRGQDFFTLNLNADTDLNGSGKVDIDADITSYFLNIKGNDVDINGRVVADQKLSVDLVKFGSIGVGDADCGRACDMTLSNKDLGNISTGNFSLGGSNAKEGIFVDNVQESATKNITNMFLNNLAEGGRITFAGSSSTFHTLEAVADGGINVLTDLTTTDPGKRLDPGLNLRVTGNSKGKFSNTISIADGINLKSKGYIRLGATNGIIASGPVKIIGQDGIILNSNLTSYGETTLDSQRGPISLFNLDRNDQRPIFINTLNNPLNITTKMGINLAENAYFNSGTATTTLSAAGRTVFLNDGRGQDFSRQNDRIFYFGQYQGAPSISPYILDKITAGNLVINTEQIYSNINADQTIFNGVTSRTPNNNFGPITLNADHFIAFYDGPSNFNTDLTLNAGNYIHVRKDLTVDGNLTINTNLTGYKETPFYNGWFAVDHGAKVVTRNNPITATANRVYLDENSHFDAGNRRINLSTTKGIFGKGLNAINPPDTSLTHISTTGSLTDADLEKNLEITAVNRNLNSTSSFGFEKTKIHNETSSPSNNNIQRDANSKKPDVSDKKRDTSNKKSDPITYPQNLDLSQKKPGKKPLTDRTREQTVKKVNEIFSTRTFNTDRVRANDIFKIEMRSGDLNQAPNFKNNNKDKEQKE